MSKKLKEQKEKEEQGQNQSGDEPHSQNAAALDDPAPGEEEAFLSGFHSVHNGEQPSTESKQAKAAGSEPPAGESATEPHTAQSQQAAPTQADAEGNKGESAQADTQQPVLAGMTEAELKSLLAHAAQVPEFRQAVEKQLRQVFGKFGELQSQISQALKPGAATKREINAEALKRMKAEYPELASLLAEDLSEVLSSLPVIAAPAQQDMASIERIVQERVQSAVDDLNEQFLSRFHSDWQDIARSDDLQLWLSTKGQEYKDKFLSSNSAVFIANGLDEFKAWRARTAETRQRNQDRLQRAVPPQGGAAPPGPSTLSDDEAFELGYKLAHGGQSSP